MAFASPRRRIQAWCPGEPMAHHPPHLTPYDARSPAKETSVLTGNQGVDDVGRREQEYTVNHNVVEAIGASRPQARPAEARPDEAPRGNPRVDDDSYPQERRWDTPLSLSITSCRIGTGVCGDLYTRQSPSWEVGCGRKPRPACVERVTVGSLLKRGVSPKSARLYI
jgi:hypothetical protein